MSIDLASKRIELVSIAEGWFFTFTTLPENVRQDKKRTGMQIYIREPGTRNLVFAPIFKPSEAAPTFCVEKAVRSWLLRDFSSQNSEDIALLHFSGSVTTYINDIYLQSSTSGLLSVEDVAVSVMMQSRIWRLSPAHICENIRKYGGLLPKCFEDPEHYLYPFVNGTRFTDSIPSK